MTETLSERIQFYEQLISPIFIDAFPLGFELRPDDWVLTNEVVNRPVIEYQLRGEKISIRPIGTMDVEFLSNAVVERARGAKIDLVENYPCGLKCPGCFSEEDIFGDTKNLMTWQEVMQVLDVAQEIGLTSIKFLGPGELFQNPDLFDILDACESRSLAISIFTKGAELGDDELAQRNFGHLGIGTAKQLVERISKYKYLRILLGFNSLFTARQDAFVGSTSVTSTYKVVDGKFEARGIAHYTQKRNQALVNLAGAGFNDVKRGQHLTLVMAPIHRNQIDEVATMYEWAARRNMPLIVTPSMESGPKAQELVKISQKADPENDWIREVYQKVYGRAFEIGITTFSELEKKGPSAYIGAEGCNQVANGLMMRLNGQVKICPGSSRPSTIYGNVHGQDGNLDPQKIVELWLASPNYKMGPLENNWCPAKTTMLPYELQNEVIKELGFQNGGITIMPMVGSLQTQAIK